MNKETIIRKISLSSVKRSIGLRSPRKFNLPAAASAVEESSCLVQAGSNNITFAMAIENVQ